jgi:hypothetical protein
MDCVTDAWHHQGGLLQVSGYGHIMPHMHTVP